MSQPHPLRIIFLGTPDFAVTSLKAMVETGYHIVAVITAPDKPAGRGLKLQQSPVKRYALEQGLPVLQPTNLKKPEFVEELKTYQADLQVVIAFRMLPEVVWNMPRLGTFNLHASLLPKYRGAAPINWAIMNGEQETGVTTFFLRHEIDTGNIVFSDQVAITPEETAGTLHDKLMEVGAHLVLKTLAAVETDQVTLIEQPTVTDDVPHAPKIHKPDCEVRWDQPTLKVYNHIRGLSPYPTAWTTIGDKSLKLFGVTMEVAEHSQPAGTLVTDGKKTLKVATQDGYIAIQQLQLQGKKRMGVEDFLRGFAIPSGQTMGG